MRARDRWSALAFSSAFLFVGAVFAVGVESPRSPGAFTVGALTLAFAAASCARFEVGTVLFLPTQLVFVPMLFLLPLGWVPLATCAGLALGDLADVVRRDLAVERLVLAPLNSWYSVGPVLVLAAAGITGPDSSTGPSTSSPSAGSSPPTTSSRHRASTSSTASRSARSAVHVSRLSRRRRLAPIGLLVAIASVEHAVAIVLVLPLLALLVVFARERQVRIDHALELTSYRGTALLLGDVVEADDAYTGSTAATSSSSCRRVRRLGLDARDRRDAEFTALLHDVGKIRIPSEIINKPGPLDDGSGS